MPQLLSRMDQTGWLTPSMADILEQGAAPPGGEEVIRAQALELQQTLADNGAPIRIVNVRPTTSRTLYIARPDFSGRRDRKQIITQSDITRSFAKLNEQHPDWSVGFMPKLQESGTIGFLLRTPGHQRTRLRQLLVRTPFREHPSSLALALGVTLEQQLVIRDLATCGHLLIIGAEADRRAYLWGILLTLTMLNTPGELRLALAGMFSQGYSPLIDTPHVLGRMLRTPVEGQRLLDGMVKEIQRRQQWFKDRSVEDIDAYNQALAASNLPPLPRIVFLIDSLSDPQWKEAVENWTPSVYDLIIHGAQTGIHLLLTSSYDTLPTIPDLIRDAVTTKLLLPAASASYGERLRGLPSSAHAFVDAVLLEQDKEARELALETCTISEDEIQRTVAYWRQASTQRVPKITAGSPTPASGVTTLLPAVRDVTSTQEISPAPVYRPDAETLVRATRALSDEGDDPTLKHAQALAAYLGWLSVGALHDVLGLSLERARSIMLTLQNRGVLDHDASPTPRFIRLAGNPMNGEPH